MGAGGHPLDWTIAARFRGVTAPLRDRWRNAKEKLNMCQVEKVRNVEIKAAIRAEIRAQQKEKEGVCNIF
jgi:hypothetical protein